MRSPLTPFFRSRLGSALGLAVIFGSASLLSAQPVPEKPAAEAKEAAPSAEDLKFEARFSALQQRAMKALMAEMGKGILDLQKEFPKREEVYQVLMELAGQAEPEKARKYAELIVANSGNEEIKDAAQKLLNRLNLVGKPVEIKFAAVDGREVDTTKLKGKVVLVDFWATWCGPCVKELPNVQAAYEKYHDKGFEIVGISFDQKKYLLESFVQEKKMPWPQYFDGKGWGNDFGQKYGIQGIPAMWMLDKKGNLRHLDAQEDLTGKIETLLAEK